MQSPSPQPVADAAGGNWVDRFAPGWLKPYARLARWDRPIGFWLLFWPCAFGLGLAALEDPARGFDVPALVFFLVGAVLMRGAGCTFNDIVDRDIDAQVARTRSRPIPSGQVTVVGAASFLAVQMLLALVVVLRFNALTVGLAISSLALVAVYPFMKRITWWPQLFLGLAFSWGALVAWTSQAGGLAPAPLLLYAGCVLWTVGYDTIYAAQDVEDDALIGVKSTARLFGPRLRAMVALFYAGALLLWAGAAFLVGGGLVTALGLAAPIALLGWQVITLEPEQPASALARFKHNQWVGLAVTATLVLASWLKLMG